MTTEQAWRAHLVPLICAACLTVMNLAFYSKAAPTLRLVELTTCREYYQEHDPSVINGDGYIDEQLCKIDAVQRKVAWLFAADELLHFCCDFLATIPLGFLVDRVGAKPALVLNFGGFILSWAWTVLVCVWYNTFSVNWVLLAPIFNIFGGASHVMTALLYAEAALYTKDRVTTFSLLEGLIQISELVGPIIGASLLLQGIFTPYYFIFPLALLSLPLTLFLPSRGLHPDSQPTDGIQSPAPETEPLLDPSSNDQPENSPPPKDPSNPPFAPIRFASLFGSLRTKFVQFYSLFRQFRIVQYAYAAMLVTTLGKQALHILLQYVSKRFGVTIAQAAFLFSIKAVVVLLLYTLVLPAAYHAMSARSSNFHSDLRLARLSCLLLMAGTFWMGVSWNIIALVPGLVIYASGFIFPVVVRSLVTSAAAGYGHGHGHGIPIPLLYSGIAIAETAGSFIGATLLTGAFTSTLSRGGVVAGVPFFICSAFYASIAIPTWFVRLDKADGRGRGRLDEDEDAGETAGRNGNGNESEREM
ncbi:major facilitator superfamily domain-containing protein [Aspergillus lucknowensis]|uniref:Major facilitator superfamily domain-containing protein n=1 Tax=Aspergillus lucknowensis TaxID=176173 RepID=A0ABR4LY43_9EURO